MNSNKHYSYLFFTLLMVLFVSLTHVHAQSTPPITDVLIDGNANVDDTLIRSVSTLKSGNLYNPRDVATSIKQLYRLGLFSDIKIYASEGPTGGVILTISVREYPLLDRIEFKGNDKVKSKDLERENFIFQGQAVSPFRVTLAKEKLLKLYREKGYLLADVDEGIFVTEGTAVLELTIAEGKKVKLGEIFVAGNRSVPDQALANAMKKKSDAEEELFWKEGDLRRERVLDTFEKATEEYRKYGFRSARVTSDSLWYSDDKSKMYMKIGVAEGEKSIMGTLAFEGNTVFTDDQLHSIFALKEGEVFNETKYGESLGKLYETYGELGYLYANPFPQEISRSDSVDVTVSLNEGAPAKVHRINIVGNTKTKDKVIRREMVMKPSQVFRRSSLMRSQRDIFQLNFFQDVVPDIQPLPDGDVDVTMQVQEKPTGTANAGAGFSGLDGLVGTVSVVIPNFRGNGQTANFSTEFGSRRNSVSIGFIEPWLFDTPTSAGIDLFRTERFWFTEFKVREIGTGLSVGRRFRNSYFRINGGYRLTNLEYDDFNNTYFYADAATMTPIYGVIPVSGLIDSTNQITVPANVQLRKDLLANSGVTSSVSNSIVRDSRNLPQFATSGMRHSMQTQVAGLGGDIKFFRQVYTSDFYLPLFSGTSISFKGKFGYTANPFNSRGVPFNERYFPGGISFDGMVRGYGNNSIGPYTTSLLSDGRTVSTRIGGRSMLIYTLEYQIPIVDQRKSTSPVYALGFFEAGNSWDKISQTALSPGDMKKSVGFGIRVVMPLVGVMGFDFGYGFNAPSDPVQARISSRSGWNTHFQLGQQF
jgi:outer membrane protein insertion porin family